MVKDKQNLFYCSKTILYTKTKITNKKTAKKQAEKQIKISSHKRFKQTPYTSTKKNIISLPNKN